jgi:hypothetical protein
MRLVSTPALAQRRVDGDLVDALEAVDGDGLADELLRPPDRAVGLDHEPGEAVLGRVAATAAWLTERRISPRAAACASAVVVE